MAWSRVAFGLATLVVLCVAHGVHSAEAESTQGHLRANTARRLTCTSCPFGQYEVSPCAGGNDTTPVCSPCSLGCPTGEELITPCGVDRDRVCAPSAHADCARAAVTLTEAQLMTITENNCQNCNLYVSHINTALQESWMACPLRLSAFIAQTRHATDGFKFLKASNNGAGAIHLQPSNFETACNGIPELKTAFTNELGGCASNFGTESQRADIIARPEFAFRAGVWWFVSGAQIMLDEVCGDLRFDSDCGLGGAPYFTTTASPGEGFQKVTTCVGGFGVDPGRQQRADYYTAARAAFTDEDPEVCGDILGAAVSTQASFTVLLLAVALVSSLVATLA